MDLVVDANILIAVLIKEGTTYELLFDGRFHLFTPEYVFAEVEKHKEEILKKTERTTTEFYQFLEILKRRITIIPLEELIPFTQRAKAITPDPNDTAYIALALHLNCAIWSNDKPLKERQNKITVYNTKEILEL